MITKTLFAHAEEDHSNSLESTQHWIETNALGVVPVLLAIMILIPYLIARSGSEKSPRKGLAAQVLMGELFIVGVLTYSAVPALSIICISLGFLFAFAFALGGIAKS